MKFCIKKMDFKIWRSYSGIQQFFCLHRILYMFVYLFHVIFTINSDNYIAFRDAQISQARN